MNSQPYPNIVMVTLDCVRPDFLGCYGNQGVRTPNINRLAAHGTVYEQAITQAPCTWVSHAGIFTGVYPPTHGLRTPFDTISQEVVTLAETLSDMGFATAGFPANDLVGTGTGLHRGFDFYYENYDGDSTPTLSANKRNPWPKVMEAAGEWLKAQKTSFYAWFHYMDTHHLPECHSLPEYYRLEFNQDWQFYQGKISYADEACVGKILSLLEQSGFLDNTLLVIFADHGEELDEDNQPRHNGNLSDSVLRVPLIFSYADGSGAAARVPRQVRTVDIMPTILRFLGVFPESPPGVDGSPLFENQTDNILFDRECRLAYAENLPENLAAVRSEEWKFVNGGTGDALFHLPSDPGESKNVMDQNPLTGKFYREQLERIWRKPSSGPLLSVPVDIREHSPADATNREETMKLLMSLGYV